MRNALGSVCAIAIGLTAATLARPASAQAMGNQGDLSIGVERVMGVWFYDEGDEGGSSTNIGLGMAPFPSSPYHLARIGVDYFVIDNLSIGGSLGFADINREGRDNAISGALINPRVGYAIEFNKTFGFWPRGGFTYRNFGDNEEFALTLEANFYAAPWEHVAFTFGPLMDLGLAGTRDEAKNFALVSAGMLVWF